jgi:hypothetical protein
MRVSDYFNNLFQHNCNFICHFGGIPPPKKTLEGGQAERSVDDFNGR